MPANAGNAYFGPSYRGGQRGSPWQYHGQQATGSGGGGLEAIVGRLGQAQAGQKPGGGGLEGVVNRFSQAQKQAQEAAGNAAQPPQQPQPPASPFGTESGNTYLEDRYLQRLYGTDPAFNYAAQRGMEGLGNRFSAAGAFNSGAARQQESDFYANLVAQQQGQLDALAGGASGARQAKTDSMFRTALGLAGGQSGLSTAYDLGAAGNMDAANRAQGQMFMNRTAIDSQGNQGALNNVLGIWGMAKAGQGGGGGGYNYYEPAKM